MILITRAVSSAVPTGLGPSTRWMISSRRRRATPDPEPAKRVEPVGHDGHGVGRQQPGPRAGKQPEGMTPGAIHSTYLALSEGTGLTYAKWRRFCIR
jgi:hypothetical protein